MGFVTSFWYWTNHINGIESFKLSIIMGLSLKRSGLRGDQLSKAEQQQFKEQWVHYEMHSSYSMGISTWWEIIYRSFKFRHPANPSPSVCSWLSIHLRNNDQIHTKQPQQWEQSIRSHKSCNVPCRNYERGWPRLESKLSEKMDSRSPGHVRIFRRFGPKPSWKQYCCNQVATRMDKTLIRLVCLLLAQSWLYEEERKWRYL